jgi:hypothetical protein
MSEITLEWNSESASVITQKDGPFFEIGTVTLNPLVWRLLAARITTIFYQFRRMISIVRSMSHEGKNPETCRGTREMGYKNL